LAPQRVAQVFFSIICCVSCRPALNEEETPTDREGATAAAATWIRAAAGATQVLGQKDYLFLHLMINLSTNVHRTGPMPLTW